MGNEGTQAGKWSVPIGHGASPILAPVFRGEERGKLRGAPLLMVGARTENRHWWVGKESQGDRENPR
jgi:hypothetical protein